MVRTRSRKKRKASSLPESSRGAGWERTDNSTVRRKSTSSHRRATDETEYTPSTVPANVVVTQKPQDNAGVNEPGVQVQPMIMGAALEGIGDIKTSITQHHPASSGDRRLMNAVNTFKEKMKASLDKFEEKISASLDCLIGALTRLTEKCESLDKKMVLLRESDELMRVELREDNVKLSNQIGILIWYNLNTFKNMKRLESQLGIVELPPNQDGLFPPDEISVDDVYHTDAQTIHQLLAFYSQSTDGTDTDKLMRLGQYLGDHVYTSGHYS